MSSPRCETAGRGTPRTCPAPAPTWPPAPRPSRGCGSRAGTPCTRPAPCRRTPARPAGSSCARARSTDTRSPRTPRSSPARRGPAHRRVAQLDEEPLERHVPAASIGVAAMSNPGSLAASAASAPSPVGDASGRLALAHAPGPNGRSTARQGGRYMRRPCTPGMTRMSPGTIRTCECPLRWRQCTRAPVKDSGPPPPGRCGRAPSRSRELPRRARGPIVLPVPRRQRRMQQVQCDDVHHSYDGVRDAVHGLHPDDQARRGARADRPQRRRQEHHAADPRHAAVPRQGPRAVGRPRRLARALRDPPAHRLPRRRHRPLPRHDRRRLPAVLRRVLRPDRQAAAKEPASPSCCRSSTSAARPTPASPS
jgi:hypothetical protein